MGGAAAKSVLRGGQRGEASCGSACNVRCAVAGNGDPSAHIVACPPKISRIDQRAGWTQFDGEGVVGAAAKGVLGGVQRGEASTGVTRDVSCPRAINADPIAIISTVPPEISRIDQCASGAQLGGEGILGAAICVLCRVQRGEPTAGVTGDVSRPRAVDCDCSPVVVSSASQVCRIYEYRIDDQRLRMIVTRYREAHLSGALRQLISARNLHALAADFLVHQRPALPQFLTLHI